VLVWQVGCCLDDVDFQLGDWLGRGLVLLKDYLALAQVHIRKPVLLLDRGTGKLKVLLRRGQLLLLVPLPLVMTHRRHLGCLVLDCLRVRILSLEVSDLLDVLVAVLYRVRHLGEYIASRLLDGRLVHILLGLQERAQVVQRVTLSDVTLAFVRL
jgi:hypothetical protein